MKQFKSLWDLFSDHFGRTIFHPQFFAKKFAWQAVELAQKESKGVLLDIGCGRMPYRNVLLPKVKKYIGLDHPETAKLYNGEVKPDIYADATKIPLKDKSIDTVLMLMVLEHLDNPQKALKEIKRILKPGGRFIFSTVQMYPIHDAPFDYFRYTRFGLKNLLESCGFTVVQSISQGSFWEFWGLSLNVYLFQTILLLTKKKATIIIAFLLIFPFYCIAVAMNLFMYIPSLLSNDTKSRFNISHVVFAKPK
jgi:SAM-dependent methyltransferase